MIDDGLITEEWLKSVGFRWHQLDRQPDKHWLLWLGGAIDGGMFSSFEDLGLELAPNAYAGPNRERAWFCWLRADTSHRYSRFVHIRHIRTQEEVRNLVQVLSGQEWNPANHWGGSLYTPQGIEHIGRSLARADHRMRESGPKWSDIEKDDTRGHALPQHMEAQVQQLAQGKEVKP